MAQRFAIIDPNTNLVKNVVQLDSPEEWSAHNDGCYALQSDQASPGDLYNADAPEGEQFTPQPE